MNTTDKSPSPPATRDCLLVLGVHRSGTSALAGLLAHLGCGVPVKSSPADENNEKGYFEPTRVWGLNDIILDTLGGRWDGWRPVDSATLDKTQFRDFRARARHILREEFRDDPLIVLKDPRICQLVPFWLEVLGFAGFTPRLILTHRNPVDVAASLNRRNGFDLSLGLWIWLNHVLAAEIATRGMTRVFTSYDRVMRDWQHEAGRIEQGLGVTLPGLVDGAAAQVGDFLSPDLKHFGSDARTTLKNPALPGWIARVFSTLDRWAEGGERAGDYAALDRIRTAFTAGTKSQLIFPAHELLEGDGEG